MRDDLSLDERKTYIDAVKCLQNKKPVTPKSIAPGARNRLDDFTVTHVNQTLFIHFSVRQFDSIACLDTRFSSIASDILLFSY